MLKKSVYALALCGLVSGQAFALTNTGFEAGTGANPAGWIAALGAEGVMTSVASGTTLYTVNDETGTAFSYAHDDGAAGTGVLAADGNNFGMLEICPASTLAPLLYVQLIWATLLGWLVFHHLPDVWAVLGMGVIGASGLWLAMGDRLRR